MTYSYGITLLILCPLIFLASFIDSIAGGGGLVSLPAYMLVGIPVHNAYGTNKFPAALGTAAAVGNYIRGGCVDYIAAVPGGIGALIGSWIGTRLAISLSPAVLRICLVIILPAVGVFVFFGQGVKDRGAKSDGAKNVGAKNSDAKNDGAVLSGRTSPRSKRYKLVASFLIGLVFGCYDGFFGPGTGMFMTLALSGLVRLDLIKSVGTTKVMNFASNAASMITWLVNGKILFPIAVPCAVCSIAGGFLGSRMAMKTGKKFIRAVLAFVAVLLFAKILLDVIELKL